MVAPLLPLPQHPDEQRLPGQQGAPASPHFWQVASPVDPAAQTVLGSVHAWVEDAQHPLPSFPHTHWPDVHVPEPPEVQRLPSATQLPPEQQPPFMHAVAPAPLQQGPPGRPQTVQVLLR